MSWPVKASELGAQAYDGGYSSPRVGVLGLLDTAPTLNRGTVIRPAEDVT